MNTSRSTRIALLAAAVASITLTACVVAPVPPPQVRYEPVMVAPPPMRAEVIGVAPYPGYFWIGGFWGWHGGRHEWVPGHWEAPRDGYRWTPHHWEQRGSEWHEHAGRWERR